MLTFQVSNVFKRHTSLDFHWYITILRGRFLYSLTVSHNALCMFSFRDLQSVYYKSLLKTHPTFALSTPCGGLSSKSPLSSFCSPSEPSPLTPCGICRSHSGRSLLEYKRIHKGIVRNWTQLYGYSYFQWNYAIIICGWLWAITSELAYVF